MAQEGKPVTDLAPPRARARFPLWQIAGSVALLSLGPLLALAAVGAAVPLFRTLLVFITGLLVLAALLRVVEELRDGGRAGTAPAFRMLVSDVDGTLVGADQTISPRVKAALAAARRAGVVVALCTGRSPAAAARFVAELDLPGPHIFFDGALVSAVEGDEVIYCCRPDPGVLADLAARCRTERVPLELYTREGHFVEEVTAESDWHGRIQGVAPRWASFDELLARCGGRPPVGSALVVVKGELVALSAPDKEAVERLEAKFAGRLRFSHAKVPGHERYDLVNVVHPAVSKGEALRHLAEYYGVALAEVVAVGDGANDIPLLEAAGVGVAMGDAPMAVKGSARIVTSGVADDGLALAVERLLDGGGA